MTISRYVLVLLLLLAPAIASNEKIECIPENNPVHLDEGLNTVSCYVLPPKNLGTNRVFDIEVTFNPPQGMYLAENETRTKIIGYLDKNSNAVEEVWSVNVTKNGIYDLSKSFEVTWDDSVSLEVFEPKKFINTSKGSISLRFVGKTDSASFCERMILQRPYDKKWKDFWSDIDNCLTKIYVEGPLVKIDGKLRPTVRAVSSADPFGTFNFTVNVSLLLPKNNTFTLTVIDPSGNTKSEEFTVYYNAPPPTLLDDPNVRLAIGIGAILFVIVVGLIAYWLSKKRAEAEVEKTLKMKEEEERKKHLEELKNRKIYLKEKLKELNTKKVNVGLTADEISQERAYENELVRIIDELLSNEDYLEELKERARKILEEVRSGRPSGEIRKELVREGYTEDEMNLIKKYFEEIKKKQS